MATKLTSPNYLRNAKLPAPKLPGVRSKFAIVNFVSCFHKNACAFSQEFCSQCCFVSVAEPSLVHSLKRMTWSVRSSVDGSGLDPSSTNSTNGRTRLLRAIQAIQTRLCARIQELKKNLPMKLLFFLVGFYCATTFSTVIGQTGDWDILSAALAVVVVEGIGALMYGVSLPMISNIRSLITMFNYWKAGLSLGLFLDSFKYEMDNIFGLSNLLNFEIDAFSMFY
ncbi:DUF565 domain-containing protein [Cephalotus follicularis]|uniref:DUF565 domain-containing protein n=1 Tax=Cephalotus follicularis TaxID=3775 RepID=A0A1Q3CEL9_CEPFO|nr:DUF565 domain-containing protein [Cephalotus follicularis]